MHLPPSENQKKLCDADNNATNMLFVRYLTTKYVIVAEMRLENYVRKFKNLFKTFNSYFTGSLICCENAIFNCLR